MERLEIEPSKMTPKVILDKEQRIFCIEGNSMPENPTQFYNPILDWVKECIKDSKTKIVFDFKIQYFNTSSSKMFLCLLELMESAASKGVEISINWHFANGDDEMKEAGEELLELVSLPYALLENDF